MLKIFSQIKEGEQTKTEIKFIYITYIQILAPTGDDKE